MRQSLHLRLGQQLTMTPQLQQAIRLLQLSSLDLQAEIQDILESNLMLERLDEAQESSLQRDESLDSMEETSHADTVYEADPGGEKPDTALSDQPSSDDGWEDNYDTYDGVTSYSRNDAEEQRDPFAQHAAPAEDLHEHLFWQMRLTPFSDSDLAIATAIIDAIDETGYLRLPVEDIYRSLKDDLDIDLDEVEAVLHRVQRFDPAGVGARTPAECLLLQLDQLPSQTPWLAQARTLVQQYLNLLAGRDFNTLMRRLKISREELQAAIRLIQSLNPHPGFQLSPAEPQYVIPDVFVYRHKNAWRVEINSDIIPRLRINSHYAKLARQTDDSTDNSYLKTHLQEARWFLKSLRNRNETLLKVAKCIVQLQQAFFDRGEEHMKPLVLRDIAETVGMHESTISRVTMQKYMHTPRGIYEFKYFFSSHVSTSNGGECSSTAIRAMIKKLISEENPRKPLSDSNITKYLDKEGIRVARRTVAKYREAMSIPSSTDRKRLI